MLKSKSAEQGLTVIELLLSLVILSMIMGIAYGLLDQGMLCWNFGDNDTEVVQNARVGCGWMADEIRHAREVYAADVTQILFWWKDLNGDEIADPDEQVRYSWSGNPGDSLMRTIGATTDEVANYVEDLKFEYRDTNNEVLPPPVGKRDRDAIQLVTVTLTIKKSTLKPLPHDFRVRMRVGAHPRNM